MSENSKNVTEHSGRNAHIVLSSDSACFENIRDPEFNRNYLTVKPKITPAIKLSASAPNLNKCIEQGGNLAKSDLNIPLRSSERLSSSRCSLSSAGGVTTAAKATPSPKSIIVAVEKPKTQVGMDRYITVLKRGRSPKSAEIASAAKITKDSEKPRSQNRFAILQEEIDAPNALHKSIKPPPIYLREKNSNNLVKMLISLIGENSFYVTPLKRGNISETKIQVNCEGDYRKTVSELERHKKNFYTYQLKSAKGLQVVIKGIDSDVDPQELKLCLINKGFNVKAVSNIRNRERIPQPLFRVELEPNDMKLKKSETHPIYELKYIMHRRVTVEEPHKRTGPVQCLNCQEYGHTKTYCKLPTVCVVCGDLHETSKCNKARNDPKVKKCSNCGGNHTANYRGCPVFEVVKRSLTNKSVSVAGQSQKPPITNIPVLTHAASNQMSYASILKTNQPTMQKEMPTTEQSSSIFSRLEGMLENLINSMNLFMTNTTSMMQEMQKMQSTLLQAILNRP